MSLLGKLFGKGPKVVAPRGEHELNQKGICIHCAHSESAIRHFGWACTRAAVDKAEDHCAVCNKPLENQKDFANYSCVRCGFSGLVHTRCIFPDETAQALSQAAGFIAKASVKCPKCGD